ncbi:uncharacterized protein TRIADDRAFT_59405 [Trichoplax adhaerens]|uniref:FCH domain-containing protein n=1 Tax=Trichoplax adhaerens TaxID=10228 RepID=B3S4Z5_TRIAD|nr:hypothetical protein TRIADDRAFT_59405 [Trichoplax adhaerens]EDV22174.1 hypothetical protein TRIADDRAFT_59405 [Trichoplax adhaerens]|eukprot:XP_002115329.1 hypothetical protein TRIADDRAFT_59405 [Trichoplax adhaerens]
MMLIDSQENQDADQPGEKYAGFDVLYNNMKHCRNANQVFGDFLKEISVAEDTFAKALMKVAKNYANHNALGTFQPVFNYIRKSTENVSNLYQEDARKMQDLIKDIIKCGETLKEKYKLAKDSVANTADDVQTLQILSANIYKARDIYHGRESEVERLRRENATTKDIDKMLSKAKKASDDYKNALDKFPPARKNFITKFTKSCGVFHSHETFHLERMATLVKKFVELQSYFTSVVQKENDRLTKELTSMRTENLLQIFVDSKGTGNDIPVDIPFESYKDKPHEDSVHDYNRSHSKEPTKDDSKSHLFKLNFKTKKKKVDRDSTNDNLSNSANDQDEATVQDSDSSSDDEDDKKKIHVKIKPVSGGQTKSQVSVDQLRAIGSSLSLSSGVRAVKSPGGSADEDDTDNSPSLLAGTKIGLPKRKSVDSTAKIEISPPSDVKKATILNSVSSPSENPPPLPPKAKDRNSINGPLFIAGPTSPTLDKLPPPLMASNVRSSTISITPSGTIQSIPRSTSDDRGPRNEGSSPSLSLKTLSTAISATRSASMPARTEKSAIIAVALTEVVNACFKPDDRQVTK